MTGSYPVLLVDDVDAELDADRTRRALHLLSGPYQVLVASASAEAWAGDQRVVRHLRVRDGIISRFS
jgi:recombinational DNA repair ATPase RecF